MTPVEELLAAAAKLRETAAPLLGGDLDWREFFTRHGADLGLIREDEEWIALVGPALAEPLAGALEGAAAAWDGCRAHQRLLAVARAINGRPS